MLLRLCNNYMVKHYCRMNLHQLQPQVQLEIWIVICRLPPPPISASIPLDPFSKIQLLEPQFHVPSKSFFYHNRCPCVSSPVLQSCVDIYMSKCMHYMQALGKVIRRPDIKMRLESCSCEHHKKIKSTQWQTYLSSRVSLKSAVAIELNIRIWPMV